MDFGDYYAIVTISLLTLTAWALTRNGMPCYKPKGCN